MNTNGLNKLVLASLLQMAFLNLLTTPATADTAPRSEALAQAIEAHGGLETWQSYGRLDYATRDFPLGAKAPFDFTQSTDLQNRRHLTHGKDFTSGLNGEDAWAVPNVETLGIPPRFFESGNFYFIAMPFVFADPGVQSRDLGNKTFQGRAYDLVAISYPQGIGDTPEDDYILYIDAETHRLHMIDFVPTSAEVNGDTPIEELPRKALVFNQWQDAGGLLVPSKLTFYGWADGELQGDGNTYYVKDVTFSQAVPDASIFAAPGKPVIHGTKHAD